MTLLTEMRPIGTLKPNILNPRGDITEGDVAELADSIKQQGIIEPLVITPDGTVLIGHRRLLAAQLAHLQEVPVVVRDATTLEEQLTIVLIENLQRKDLTPIQEARGYKALCDLGLTASDVARKLGLGKQRVIEYLSLLRLSPTLQGMLNSSSLSIKLAITLKDLDESDQSRLAALWLRHQMSLEQIKKEAVKLQPERQSSPVKRVVRANEEAKVLSPVQNTKSPSSEMVARLKEAGDKLMSLGEVAKAVEATCKLCSMEDLEGVCAECPLPKLVGRLAK